MQSVVKYHNIKSTLKLMSQAFHQISVKIRKCEQEEWWVRHKRTNSNQKILWPGFVDCKLIWVKHENTWIAPFLIVCDGHGGTCWGCWQQSPLIGQIQTSLASDWSVNGHRGACWCPLMRVFPSQNTLGQSRDQVFQFYITNIFRADFHVSKRCHE